MSNSSRRRLLAEGREVPVFDRTSAGTVPRRVSASGVGSPHDLSVLPRPRPFLPSHTPRPREEVQRSRGIHGRRPSLGPSLPLRQRGSPARAPPKSRRRRGAAGGLEAERGHVEPEGARREELRLKFEIAPSFRTRTMCAASPAGIASFWAMEQSESKETRHASGDHAPPAAYAPSTSPACER